MNALGHFRAGKLGEAISAANEEVRAAPDDVRRRTFLFELLCFAGDYARAEKQLDVLALSGGQAALGTMVYRAALQAEQRRTEFFEQKQYEVQPLPAPVSGNWNGGPCQFITDADERIGPRLEVFLAGDYVWIPFTQIASLEMEPPRRLRDLLWAPVIVKTAPGFPLHDLGEVFVPVLSPVSWRHPEDTVRLGNQTVWELDDSDRSVPFGQKLWLVDDREVPFLDLRKVEFSLDAAAASGQ